MVGCKDKEKCYVYLYCIPFLVTSVHSVTNSTLAKCRRASILAQRAKTPIRCSPSCGSFHGKVPGPRLPFTYLYAFFFIEIQIFKTLWQNAQHLTSITQALWRVPVSGTGRALLGHPHHPSPELCQSQKNETLSCCSFLPAPVPTMHSLSLWLWRLQGPHMSRAVQHSSFCAWLIPLSVMSARSIPAVDGVRTSFLFLLNNILSYGWTTFCLSILPRWHSDCFHCVTNCE